MKSKKHPLTFFREQNEVRMRKAQDSLSVTSADTIYPQFVLDTATKLKTKFDETTPGTNKREKAYNKLNEFKTKNPGLVWNATKGKYENKNN